MAETESENIEHLRELWLRYRFYLVFILVMVLSIIMGFTYQHSADDEKRLQLNAELFALLQSSDNLTTAEMETAYATLSEQSAYPELPLVASFAMLSVYLNEGNTDKPEELLRRVIAETDDEGLRILAVLRLSEVLLSGEAYEESIALLQEYKPDWGRFPILFDERIGDVEFRRGNHAEAQAAYIRASEAAAAQSPFYVPLLRIKLGSLLSSKNNTADNAADNATENAADNTTENAQ